MRCWRRSAIFVDLMRRMLSREGRIFDMTTTTELQDKSHSAVFFIFLAAAALSLTASFSLLAAAVLVH